MKNFSKKNYVNFLCPICNKSSKSIFKIIDKFNILIYISLCPNDGLIFLNPRWTNEQYKLYYKTEYDHMKRKEIFKKIKPNKKSFKHGKSIYKNIKSFHKPKTILDIGAGNGYILDFLRDKFDAKTYFIEPSIEYKKQLKLRNHIEVDFDTYMEFDLLISRHVLEHTQNPVKHLKHIKSLMNNDSLLHISFPNNDNISKISFQNPHIYYFTDHTFNLIVEIIGLKIIKKFINNNELRYILKKQN